MTFLRFALLSAAVFPAAFAAAAEPADAEARAAALARDLAKAQTALRETQDALAKQSAEIATVRAEAATTRIQLGKAQAEAAAGRFNPASLPSSEAPAALERERTAHIATKAVLAQREAQVQDMAAERTKLESEIRVLRASTDMAKTNASAETKAILSQNADLAARSAALTRDLNAARSEITMVRHELREQGAKSANAAEALNTQLAAAQKSLATARAEMRQVQTTLETTTTAKTQIEAQHAALQRRVAGLEREAQTATAGAAALRERLEKAEAAPKTAAADLAAARQEMRALGTKAASETESLTARLATAEKSLEGTRTELREARTALEAAKTAKQQLEAQLGGLQGRIATLERDAKNAATESAGLRERLAKNEAAPGKPTPADLAAMQIQERQLATLEQELASTRTQLGQAKSALESAMANAAKPGASVETEAQLNALRETNASLRRELAATTAAARMQDRPTITEGELTLLRGRAAAARDLEQRVQQLESEKAAAMTNRDAPNGEELARLEAARAAAENKLNTVLRSYTLLTRERDALREQVQQLSVASARPAPSPAATYEPSPAFPPQPAASASATVPARSASRSNPAPVPVSFGGPEDPVPVLTVTRVAQPVQPRPTPPGSVPLGQPAFSHRIAPGETLSSIARRYYGNPKRWPEIVAANRDVLPDQRSFAAGKMIRIP